MNLEKVGFIAVVVLLTLVVWHAVAPASLKGYTGTV